MATLTDTGATMATLRTLKPGGRVRYARAFLARIGASPDIARMRGRVLDVYKVGEAPPVALIRWDDGRDASALVRNLARAPRPPQH